MQDQIDLERALDQNMVLHLKGGIGFLVNAAPERRRRAFIVEFSKSPKRWKTDYKSVLVECCAYFNTIAEEGWKE
jgi:hypothetical protein